MKKQIKVYQILLIIMLAIVGMFVLTISIMKFFLDINTPKWLIPVGFIVVNLLIEPWLVMAFLSTRKKEISENKKMKPSSSFFLFIMILSGLVIITYTVILITLFCK